ncbi:MFS transporter [Dictyobacter aurantiacus]|uniref:Tetracycline resistance MFS efflux pump n=1 Tax=Dictyobacter aurantiacus TaxID=1936993 RepID=A0A401ZT26_9CHLR|nr:MFS transporter [Dictyobacter aurantiacus]GCE09934.1 tetracycline resistance MFS efflux pump [Dictyobacter aurantiacus]
MHTTLMDQDAISTTDIDVISADSMITAIDKTPRAITSALLFLIGCITLLMTGFAIIMPIFPQRLQALGLGAETLALMEGAFGLGMFLFSTPMGTWSGRVGRKPVLFISLAGFIVTNILLALVNIPIFFILIRFVEGMLIAGLMPASMAMIGDTIPLQKQGRWIGYITTAQATGIALGPGIGGFLAQVLGFTGPFFLSAGIALLASLLAVFLVPETLPRQKRMVTKQPTIKSSTKRSQPRDASFYGLIWLVGPFLLIDFGLIFTYPFVFPQYPFFFEKVLHYSTAQYGLVISVFGLAMAISPLFLGRLSESLPKKLLIITGSILFGTLNAFMFIAPLYPLLLVGSALAGLGSALASPALGGIYLGVSNEQNRGQLMGIRGSAISAAVMLGPLAQALVGHWITAQITFAIGVILSLALVAIASILLKSPRQDR